MLKSHQCLIFLLFAVCSGCSESIDSSGQDEAQNIGSLVPVMTGGGVLEMHVDATSREEWVLLHLDEGMVTADQPWDIAFRRFSIRLNGGGSGTGTGVGQLLEGSDFASVDRAPDMGWRSDGEEADDLIFSDWFEYNTETHQLTSVPGVWVLRGGGGERYYALQVTSYYDDAGDSGIYSLRWSAIDAPTERPELSPGMGALPTSTDDPQSGSTTDSTAESGGAMAESVASGCYSGPPDHQCDCALSEAQCEASEGTWTEECDCEN